MTFVAVEKQLVLRIVSELHSSGNSNTKAKTCGNIINTLRTGDADLRFYITTVQDG